MSTKTTKITITKSTVKVVNARDEKEPKAVKKDGRYELPWKTDKELAGGWNNMKYFFTPDASGVPSEEASSKQF